MNPNEIHFPFANPSSSSPNFSLEPGTVSSITYPVVNGPTQISEPPPYLPTHVIETPDGWTYVTYWGNYSFSRSRPMVFTYGSSEAKGPLSSSAFSIFSSSGALRINHSSAQVLVASNSSFLVNYSVTFRDPPNVSEVGFLQVSADFSKRDPPKFSAQFTKATSWNASNLGSFQIVWEVTPKGAHWLKAGSDKALDISSVKNLTGFGKHSRAEIAYAERLTGWLPRLIADWGDEGSQQLFAGPGNTFPAQPSIQVRFAEGDAQITRPT